jgi:hypothetical protein
MTVFQTQLAQAWCTPAEQVLPGGAVNILYFFDLKFEDRERDLLVRLGHCSAGPDWVGLA